MSCYHSIVINAPVADVWALVKNFHDMSWAEGVVESLDHVGEVPAGQIGSQRLLNGMFLETLKAIDEHECFLRYSIDNGPGPLATENVQGYIGTVQVLPVTDGNASFVRWSSSWDHSGGGVAEFCNPIYAALLRALRARFNG